MPWSFKEQRRFIEIAASVKSFDELVRPTGRQPKHVRAAALRLGVKLAKQSASDNELRQGRGRREMTGSRSEDLRDNPVAIASFLTRALRTNDLKVVVAALGTVIRAQNVLAVAETAGLRREGLYRTFSGDGDPRIGRLLKLFAALDVELVVRALPQTPKPARPKPGRPFQTKPGLKAKR